MSKRRLRRNLVIYHFRQFFAAFRVKGKMEHNALSIVLQNNFSSSECFSM